MLSVFSSMKYFLFSPSWNVPLHPLCFHRFLKTFLDHGISYSLPRILVIWLAQRMRNLKSKDKDRVSCSFWPNTALAQFLQYVLNAQYIVIKSLTTSLGALSRNVVRYHDFTYIITLHLWGILWPLESQVAQKKILKHIIRSSDNCSGTLNAQSWGKASVV